MTDYEKLLEESGLERIPPYWDRRYTKNLDKLSKPVYEVKIESNVWMTLRDGTRQCVDIYRPDTEGETFPALIAWSAYGKEMQYLKRGPIPPESLLFDHSLEAGDVDYFVSRGYVYIIPDPRGIGKSEGEYYGVYNPQEHEDVYDTIEWAAVQDWCDSNVSMIGFSYFGIIQMLAAAQQPPHLKCIMPMSFTDDYYQHGHYGGVTNTYLSIYHELCPSHTPRSWSQKIYSEEELKEKIQKALDDPDLAVNSYFLKILHTWPPQYHTFFFDVLLHPEDGPFWRARSAQEMFDKVQVPVYLKGGFSSPNGRWSAPAMNAFSDDRLAVPKKVSAIEGYANLELPYRPMNEEALRWYDHWLKGVDTGLMDEPPVKIGILGSGHRYEKEWPLARTQWKNLYLRSFGKLSWLPESECNVTYDSFTHQPPNITDKVDSLVYRTPRFNKSMEFTGPITLHLHAALDSEDANFIVYVKEIFPDGSAHPCSRYGALKASFPLDREKSRPWYPVHDYSRRIPVVPGEINEYVIEINPMGAVIHAGHALELEIKAMDPHAYQNKAWTGKVGYMGPVPTAHPVHYKIFRDRDYQSRLVMPLIPASEPDQWIQPLVPEAE